MCVAEFIFIVTSKSIKFCTNDGLMVMAAKLHCTSFYHGLGQKPLSTEVICVIIYIMGGEGGDECMVGPHQ